MQRSNVHISYLSCRQRKLTKASFRLPEQDGITHMSFSIHSPKTSPRKFKGKRTSGCHFCSRSYKIINKSGFPNSGNRRLNAEQRLKQWCSNQSGIAQGWVQGSNRLTFSRLFFSVFRISWAYLNVWIDTDLISVKEAVIQERVCWY